MPGELHSHGEVRGILRLSPNFSLAEHAKNANTGEELLRKSGGPVGKFCSGLAKEKIKFRLSLAPWRSLREKSGMSPIVAVDVPGSPHSPHRFGSANAGHTGLFVPTAIPASPGNRCLRPLCDSMKCNDFLAVLDHMIRLLKLQRPSGFI
jgi:hypothetical protein